MKNQNLLISLAYIKANDNPLRVFCHYILYLLLKEPTQSLRADELHGALLSEFGINMPQQLINNCIHLLEKQNEVARLPHGAGYQVTKTSFNIDSFKKNLQQLHEHEIVVLNSLITFVQNKYKKES